MKWYWSNTAAVIGKSHQKFWTPVMACKIVVVVISFVLYIYIYLSAIDTPCIYNKNIRFFYICAVFRLKKKLTNGLPLPCILIFGDKWDYKLCIGTYLSINVFNSFFRISGNFTTTPTFVELTLYSDFFLKFKIL